MGPQEKEAILKDVAGLLADESLNSLDIDQIDLVEGDLLVELEDGTTFALKIEEV